MRAHYERHGELPDTYLQWLSNIFTGSNYLFMWPFPKHMMKLLKAEREVIINGLHS